MMANKTDKRCEQRKQNRPQNKAAHHTHKTFSIDSLKNLFFVLARITKIKLTKTINVRSRNKPDTFCLETVPPHQAKLRQLGVGPAAPELLHLLRSGLAPKRLARHASPSTPPCAIYSQLVTA